MSSAQRLDLTALSGSVFCELERQRERSCVYSILTGVVAIIPLIDRASNDDFNGGHIEISSNFDLCCENPAVDSDSAELGGN